MRIRAVLGGGVVAGVLAACSIGGTPPVNVLEVEPNDSAGTANTFPVAPDTFSGQVTYMGDSDWWAHTFPESGTLTVQCGGAGLYNVRDNANFDPPLCSNGSTSGPIAISDGQTLTLRIFANDATDAYTVTATFVPD